MKYLRDFKKKYLNALFVGWFLAKEQIKHSGKGTTSLIIFIMTLTFLNMVVVSGLLVGLITGSFSAYREYYSGDVIVSTATGRDYIENSQGLITYIKNIPQVTSFSARHGVGVQMRGTLSDNPKKNERKNQIGIRVTGIDPVAEEKTTGLSRSIIRGRYLDRYESSGILIGANMIRKYSSFADANIPGLDFLRDVDIGSRVKVSFATKDGATVARDFYVRGIIKSKVDEISTRAFVLDRDLKQMLKTNQNDYQEIAIRTSDAYAPVLVSQLKGYMGDYAARIQTSDDAVPSFVRDIESTMNILGNALSSIALVVASITIFIVIYINAVTKRKFIGIMKGIGINPLAIELSYVFQAFFYGAVGSLIGLIITFGFLRPYFTAHPINFPFSDGILVATVFGSSIRVSVLLLVTLLAGYIPARLIIKKNTLDAILGR